MIIKVERIQKNMKKYDNRYYELQKKLSEMKKLRQDIDDDIKELSIKLMYYELKKDMN